MGRTGELRHELKQRFHPFVTERGFVIDRKSPPNWIDFRRITPARVDVFNIFWDKYGRPRFVINFGQCPGDGAVHFGERFPPAKVLSYMGSQTCQLRPGPEADDWFRQDPHWLPRLLFKRPDRPAAEVVDQLLALFPEVEAWFEDGRGRPHLHIMPSPFTPRPPERS